jgi:hypothetical protein
MTTWAVPGISNLTPIEPSNFRQGNHHYMVKHVLRDAAGNPSGLVLRDPGGAQRTITDFTRLHFCLGQASTWDL